MSKIDEKIWVEGDEELGEIFENVKRINQTINSL
jgi:hypothetical protein